MAKQARCLVCGFPVVCATWFILLGFLFSRDITGRSRHSRQGSSQFPKNKSAWALRGAAACAAAQNQGIPWTVELLQPLSRRSSVSPEGQFFSLLSNCAHAQVASRIDWPEILSLCFCSTTWTRRPHLNFVKCSSKAFCAPMQGGVEHQLGVILNRSGVVLVKVDKNVSRVPAFFETRERLNYLGHCDQSLRGILQPVIR